MYKTTKKVVSIILCVLMLCCAFPTAVYADTNYYVAGTDELCGTAWEPSNAANILTYNSESGLYTKTYANLKANDNYQFKITDGTWGQSWGKGKNNDNFVFAVEDDCDVTITFNPQTKEITVTGDYVVIPKFEIKKVVAVGSPNGDSKFLNGVSWNPNSSDNVMTEVSERVYQITYSGVGEDFDYAVKFALNGGWTVNFGCDENNDDGHTAVYNGDNILFDVEQESDITLTLDLSNYDDDTKEGAEYNITITPVGQQETTEPETTAPVVQEETTQPETTQPTTTESEVTEPTTTEPEDTSNRVYLDVSYAKDKWSAPAIYVWDPYTSSALYFDSMTRKKDNIWYYDYTEMPGNGVECFLFKNIADDYTWETQTINLSLDGTNNLFVLNGIDDMSWDKSMTGYWTDYATYVNVDSEMTKELTPDANDENIAKFGFDANITYSGAKLLGVQKKKDGTQSMRFISAVSSDILNASNVEDYGYVLTATTLDSSVVKPNLGKLTAYNGNVYSCKGLGNTISGKYGSDEEATNYKYITMAVNNIPEGRGIAARFFVKTKDGTYHYAKYTDKNNNEFDGCVARFSELTD